MLRWCAHCQEFQGEIKPFDDLSLTHGICPSCALKGLNLSPLEFQRVQDLKELQVELMKLGENGDLAPAEAIIAKAIGVGVSPIDLLVGLLSPLLYEVGNRWKSGVISVADEHRFTQFCEEVFRMVEGRVGSAPVSSSGAIKAVVLNTPGNAHSLGIRLVALKLREVGVDALAIWPTPSRPSLLDRLRSSPVQFLLISMALPETRPSTAQLVESITTLQSHVRPKVFIGGYAIKLGLVPPISGAEFVDDICALNLCTEPPEAEPLKK